MHVEYIHFPKRQIRSEFISERFKPYFEGQEVLDVGCDKALLKELVPNMKYTGIDIGGNPDIQLNLEEIERLPFDDERFDTVLCSDVLEHISNLHQIFAELIRVSRKTVVISLPNNWCNARRPIEKGRGSFSHYGLPLEPELDRHKWFFSLTEAVQFIEGQTKKYSFEIEDIFATEKRRPAPLWCFRRLFHSKTTYLNRYANTLWVVLRKK